MGASSARFDFAWSSRVLMIKRRWRRTVKRRLSMNLKTLRIPKPNISLSRIQTIIGLAAGVLSIMGAVVAFIRPAPDSGRLVAIVHDAKTEKPLPDATVEVLTPLDVL